MNCIWLWEISAAVIKLLILFSTEVHCLEENENFIILAHLKIINNHAKVFTLQINKHSKIKKGFHCTLCMAERSLRHVYGTFIFFSLEV